MLKYIVYIFYNKIVEGKIYRRPEKIEKHTQNIEMKTIKGRILYLVKLSYINKEKLGSFPDQQKWKQVIVSKSVF